MHSDVMELFIIASSVPVLHLNQDKSSDSSDTVLKAGRISAQDMLGEETTGELIQREVLDQSTISYARKGDLLVALRVANSMSSLGVDKLLDDILLQIENYKELVWNSFGDPKILQPLVKRLHLTLGAKLPTNPFGMATVNMVMESYFEKYSYMDTIGIVTQESWLVNVTSREGRKVAPISNDIWKNAVDLIHMNLGTSTKGIIIQDEKSIFWIRPIYYKNMHTKGGISWWALVVQMNGEKLAAYRSVSDLFNYESLIRPELYSKLSRELDFDFFIAIEPKIREMVEKEIKSMGRLGVLGQILSFVEYQVTDIYSAKVVNTDEGAYLTSEKNNLKVPWIEFLQNYRNSCSPLNPTSEQILNLSDTIFLTLNLDNLLMLLQSFVLIASDYESPCKLHIGLGLSKNFDPLIEFFNSIEQLKHRIVFYSEDSFGELDAPDTLLIVDNIPVDAQISQYKFFILENDSWTQAIMFFREVGENYSGVWTHSKDIIELIMSRVDQLSQMSN